MPNVAPYSVLAAGYDVVMEHVDYELWAEYVYGLLLEYAPSARSILELGCGTGSLALELQPMGPYRYAGTDKVEMMVKVAQAKAEMAGADLQFSVADFTDFRVDRPVDVVLLLYDGLNYLLEPTQIEALLRCAYAALVPGGLFIVDQSTPANSINNEAYFEDEGEADAFAFKRKSQYDRDSGLHTTSFDMTIDGRRFQEEHIQRAYFVEEIRSLIAASGFEEVAAYDGFTLDPATDTSERVHWVLRRL